MNQVNVDIKDLMKKAKNHNAEQLSAAKAQIEEAKAKAIIERLAKDLANVEARVANEVERLRDFRKRAKAQANCLQSVANAAAEFEEDGDYDKFVRACVKADETYTKKVIK